MPGGYKDFTAATALSADVDDYLMRQSLMRFASTAARDAALTAPETGMHCVTTDTHAVWYYNGSTWVKWLSAWTSYTPAWTNFTVGNATISAAYRYVWGDIRIRGQVTLGTTSSGTGSQILQTIPNSETANATIGAYGSGALNDGTRIYPLVVGVAANSTAVEWFHAETADAGVLSSDSPVALGTGDIFTWDITIPL